MRSAERRCGILAVIALASVVGACNQRADKPPAASGTPAAFAGSQQCSDCHQQQYAAWQKSHHALAMQPAAAKVVAGDFDEHSLLHHGVVTQFVARGDSMVVRTPSRDGNAEELALAYTFGVEPLQQYLVDGGRGRLQVLPFAWDTRTPEQGGQRWFHLDPDSDDPLHWGEREQNWNYMCAECHSTDVVMNYDAASDQFSTRYSEVSVGCEACHGPGSAHIREARSGAFLNSRKGLLVDLDDTGRAIWQMDAGSGIARRSEPRMRPTQQAESCGRCHARRAVASTEYRYQQPLADTHTPALLEEGLYFPDGQIRDEVFVYGSYLQSRMYRAGVTCNDCHEPHGLQSKTSGAADAVCAQCHATERFNDRQHTGHDAQQVACVDCHMPTRTYMRVDDRRDHSFRVPRPDLTESVGVPNACNNCHAERSPRWAADALRLLHGEQQRPEFATALVAARNGGANSQLVGVANNTGFPGIARATALAELAPPLGQSEADAIARGLVDADPLLRIAALRQHRFLPAEWRLRRGAELLADGVGSVRNAAVLAYADIHRQLTATARRDFDEALAAYRDLQFALLNRPESHVALGDLDQALGETATSFEHYESALKMAPEYAIARINYADALRQVGNDERGRELLEDGLQRQPDNAALHHSMGLLLVRLDERQRALTSLREAVRLDPGNPRYRYVLDIAEAEISTDDAGNAGSNEANTNQE